MNGKALVGGNYSFENRLSALDNPPSAKPSVGTSVCQLGLRIWGAAGGGAGSLPGGAGAFVQAKYKIKPDSQIYVIVGEGSYMTICGRVFVFSVEFQSA